MKPTLLLASAAATNLNISRDSKPHDSGLVQTKTRFMDDILNNWDKNIVAVEDGDETNPF